MVEEVKRTPKIGDRILFLSPFLLLCLIIQFLYLFLLMLIFFYFLQLEISNSSFLLWNRILWSALDVCTIFSSIWIPFLVLDWVEAFRLIVWIALCPFCVFWSQGQINYFSWTCGDKGRNYIYDFLWWRIWIYGTWLHAKTVFPNSFDPSSFLLLFYTLAIIPKSAPVLSSSLNVSETLPSWFSRLSRRFPRWTLWRKRNPFFWNI